MFIVGLVLVPIIPKFLRSSFRIFAVLFVLMSSITREKIVVV